jgi:hypothetical protein
MFMVPPYPPELLDLQTPGGFEAAFWQLYGTTDWKNRESCYEALESQYEHYYGRRRYDSFAVFCACLYKRQKKRRAARRLS